MSYFLCSINHLLIEDVEVAQCPREIPALSQFADGAFSAYDLCRTFCAP
jgi:hypothetical protein